MTDNVNHPAHYRQYKYEVIKLTERCNFLMGNAFKYILRAPFKGTEEEDLKKAVWYIKRQHATSAPNLAPIPSRIRAYFWSLDPVLPWLFKYMETRDKGYLEGAIDLLEWRIEKCSTKAKTEN